ncbi:hypothetical protein [Pseudomonas aeruginosa]|uniref:hypothetical protein n=1 Tax=Pseudomonas aeruginosa TaxID=287 RepID=UPI0013CE1429|nr:hypothetical protein [Pseudomonas aeruginosa]NPT17879.1 hypothetical protein [Pseudomonas aeruginosa]HBP0202892.1 hypothetical protein [Pseudomonas aeruginosa]
MSADGGSPYRGKFQSVIIPVWHFDNRSAAAGIRSRSLLGILPSSSLPIPRESLPDRAGLLKRSNTPLAPIIERHRRGRSEAPEDVIGAESNRLHVGHYDRKKTVSI